MAYSIEALAREYPNKTGKELFEIQKQQFEEEEREFQKKHSETLKFIDDINENGGYFKGRFGERQHYYYRIFNARMEDEIARIDVEKIVAFSDGNRITDSLHIEREITHWQKLEDFHLSLEQRITKKEWDELNDYLKNMFTKFW